jgi:hypothetical protein
MANTYIRARSPKGNVGVTDVVDAGELSAYSAGVLSGFNAASAASWTLQIGGVSGVQDVAIGKNPSGESELFSGTAGQSIGFVIGGAPGTPGQSRTDALVIYKDPFTTSVVNNGVDVTDYQVVAGTAATTGSQVAPDDAAIRAAIPTGTLKFVAVIGYVTTAYGQSSVSLGNLTLDRAVLNSLLTPVEYADATVVTSQTTTSTSYADLSTVGPAVTIDVKESGLALVTLTAWGTNNTVAAGISIGITVSGANTAVAVATDAWVYTPGAPNLGQRSSFTKLFTGLTPGATTFTMKYLVYSGGSGSGTGTFRDRNIHAVAL